MLLRETAAFAAVLLLSLVLLGAGGPAAAAVDEQIGADGAPGQNGESVEASADSSDPSNSAIAIGGRGGAGIVGGDGGDGGSARASAVTRAVSGDVEAIAAATGGAGGASGGDGTRAGAGGQARLGRVFAESNDGGSLLVFGSATGGAGGDALGGGHAGDGASVRLHDAIDGDGRGALTFIQRALGGRVGAGADGRWGSADSVLRLRKSAESLEVNAEALAGLTLPTAPPFPGPLLSGPGDATARAESRGHNDSGSVLVRALARLGQGGDARATARGETRGDGHDVRVGDPFDPNIPPPPRGRAPTSGAFGGNGGENEQGDVSAGGDARRDSEGKAHGNSRVEVHDRATGGNGGEIPIGAPGDGVREGGDAQSRARGENRGPETVKVFSVALGGAGSRVRTRPVGGFDGAGRGGEADAEARARGEGEVHANALARGGRGSAGVLVIPQPPLPGAANFGGAARAQARARGRSGSAVAQASSSFAAFSSVVARASADVREEARVEARTNAAERFAGHSVSGGLDAFAFATGNPLERDVADALEGNDEVAQRFLAEGTEPLVLALLGGRNKQYTGGDSITLTSEVEIESSILGVDSTQLFFVGFLDSEARHGGFDLLRLLIEKSGEEVFERTFFDVEEALDFFDDRVVQLGSLPGLPGPLGPGSIRVALEITSGAKNQGFWTDLVVGATVVPEPATATLLGLGLLGLGLRGRRALKTGRQGRGAGI